MAVSPKHSVATSFCIKGKRRSLNAFNLRSCSLGKPPPMHKMRFSSTSMVDVYDRRGHIRSAKWEVSLRRRACAAPAVVHPRKGLLRPRSRCGGERASKW
eukprot:1477079-Pleurochrysis_carterae.AAC.1